VSDRYQQGTWVEWDWGNGTATGKIAESYTERVSKSIDGTDVTRNADEHNPAYLIEQDDGQRAQVTLGAAQGELTAARSRVIRAAGRA
jgi:hypothetical protein